ncbi:MAG: molybdenum cofactor biosynthesis protein MoaE [Acidimicrobiales bacterium]
MAKKPSAPQRSLEPPADGPDWTGLSDQPLPAVAAAEWVVLPSCGGVVVFTGTARDHSVGRDGVTRLEYEAYEEQVVPRLDEIAAAARRHWPDLGRIVLLHRIGEVPLTEAAVVVAVSAPHRAAAFDAARFGIDTLKETVPIWKREDWSEGTSWGREAQHIVEVDHGAAPDGPEADGGELAGGETAAGAAPDGP